MFRATILTLQYGAELQWLSAFPGEAEVTNTDVCVHARAHTRLCEAEIQLRHIRDTPETQLSLDGFFQPVVRSRYSGKLFHARAGVLPAAHVPPADGSHADGQCW